MLREERKRVIFWSICQLNNWKFIVLDQYYTLLYSGILDCIDIVYITVIGEEDVSWLLNKNQKFVFDKRGEYKHYERTCLHSLLDWSKSNDADVLYIHTKGVSHVGNANVQEWRRMMEHFLIDNYDLCLDVLEDVVCCKLLDDGTMETVNGETHKLHPSGNFWWARTEYIRTLPLIRPDFDDLSVNCRYYLTERWILCNYPNVKITELYPESASHYYTSPPDRGHVKKKIETLRLNKYHSDK
jgi:hypothetical protein